MILVFFLEKCHLFKNKKCLYFLLTRLQYSIVAVQSEVTTNLHAYCDQGTSKHEMKSGQIMFYSRIFNSQAQLGTRDIQKLHFENLYLLQKSQNL